MMRQKVGFAKESFVTRRIEVGGEDEWSKLDKRAERVAQLRSGRLNVRSKVCLWRHIGTIFSTGKFFEIK
jgi:hypothetical protein